MRVKVFRICLRMTSKQGNDARQERTDLIHVPRSFCLLLTVKPKVSLKSKRLIAARLPRSSHIHAYIAVLSAWATISPGSSRNGFLCSMAAPLRIHWHLKSASRVRGINSQASVVKDRSQSLPTAHTVLRSDITLTMLPAPTISTNYISISISTSNSPRLQNTYLLMPTQQHTHSLSASLSTTKAPPTHLTESGCLRRDVSTTARSTRVGRRPRCTLRHALVKVLHERIADLRAAFGLIHSLEYRCHFGLPDVLENFNDSC